MHRANQPPPPGSPPPPSRQNRVVLQREYREKEAECFNILRDIIKDLTGEELRRRQEVLKKCGSAQPFQWPQTWQFSGAEFDAATPYYGVHFYDHQYHFIPPMDSSFN
ncbi:hypothetical protein OG21DRAFT_1520830 [Imleria badia]|nr:hypothetical protein OG21DRAFT_1520830 [Imleria badia]